MEDTIAYDDSKSIQFKKREYKARHVLRYCPLIPRLKSLIAHSVFSHLFFYADSHRVSTVNEHFIEDIHQAELFKRFANYFPLRSECTTTNNNNNDGCDLRVAFGLSADRASMSKHKPKNDYAMLPILLSIVNWPIWIRNKEQFLLLSALPPLSSHNPSLFFGTIIHIYKQYRYILMCMYYLFNRAINRRIANIRKRYILHGWSSIIIRW